MKYLAKRIYYMKSAEYEHKKVIEEYTNATNKIGLWKSEQMIFSEHIKPTDKILDVGCGAGRTTFALYELGYHDIIGIDLSKGMINSCTLTKKEKELDIQFLTADATKLPFETETFDVCIFLFNGLMTIPKLENRLKAMQEISRVLKSGGKFIFTTHDNNSPEFIDYWTEEKIKWEKGLQDKRLYEYGDLIFQKHAEYGDAINFVHVPQDNEIEEGLEQSGFSVIYKENRSRICEETDAVKNFSADCLFWIAEKQ